MTSLTHGESLFAFLPLSPDKERERGNERRDGCLLVQKAINNYQGAQCNVARCLPLVTNWTLLTIYQQREKTSDRVRLQNEARRRRRGKSLQGYRICRLLGSVTHPLIGLAAGTWAPLASSAHQFPRFTAPGPSERASKGEGGPSWRITCPGI